MNYNEILRKMQKLNITGNVVPINWFKTIRREASKGKKGRPYLLAINILSEIVYWYRPREIRDEGTGALIRYEKRFKSDLLQRSYAQLAEMFGYSKREVTEAVIRLEKIGVIKRHFRTVKTEMSIATNVLFLELIPDVLEKLTLQIPNEDPPSPDPDKNTPIASDTSGSQAHIDLWDRCPTIMGEVSHYNGRPLTLLWETNTENTTENTTEINNNNDHFSNFSKNDRESLNADKKENLDFEKTQVSDSAINVKGSTPSNKRLNEEFNQVWDLYPKKQGKKPAQAAFIRARRNGVSLETIISGIKSYLDYISTKKISQEYIKQGSTFFNQEAWNDDWTVKSEAEARESYGIIEKKYKFKPNYDIEAYERSCENLFFNEDDDFS